MPNAAQLLVSMLDELGRITDEPGRLTRTFLSPGMQRANELVGDCLKAAGLKVRVDSVGNLIGRLEGAQRGAKTLLLGSHLDTVRDAGRFDGPLGVLLPIVALAELQRRGVQLPFAVEVLGFSEEEGVRFGSAYLGSEGYTGRLKPATLKLRDADGVSVLEALQRWNGLTSGRSKRAGVSALHLKATHEPSNLIGYIEVHIEQGPVLEARKLAVGVVSAIAGQSRFKLTWTGQAGHAGTTPMALRRDALAGAAEFITGVEAIARRTPGLVATVGALTVSPGAANVIPGAATHTLDVRHAKDSVRRSALMRIGRLATQIAIKRGLERRWQRTQENGAVDCSVKLTARLARSVQAVQGKALSLVSGAGHDGVVMSTLTPVAMLFVRCRDGLSHHPDEYASPKDLAVALRVMVDFLERLAAEYRG
ncbi:MAG: allantoate amidohydrolase [bacterium]|nr:allantoate amidohydrolase [bacterium]MDI1336515.1 allantoate amidohydrolase [Lacunisphaera sp.]